MTGPTPSRPTAGGGSRGARVVPKLPVVGELWGPTGSAQLDHLELPDAYAIRVDSLRDLVEIYDREVATVDAPSTAASPITPATKPSRPSTAWAGSSGPSSWPRSAT